MPWATLRAAADAPLIRQCIQVRKRGVTDLGWDITIAQSVVDAAQGDGTPRADVEKAWPVPSWVRAVTCAAVKVTPWNAPGGVPCRSEGVYAVPLRPLVLSVIVGTLRHVLDLSLAGSAPTPAPTVTVVVPTSIPTPVITVTTPPENLDPWKDIWLSDFGGAALGATVTVIAVFVAAYLAARSARLGREEERRIAFGIQFLEVVSELNRRYVLGGAKEIKEATMNWLIWQPRMQALYGSHRQHRLFFEWMNRGIDDFDEIITRASNMELSPEDRRKAVGEVVPVLIKLEHNLIKWIQDPKGWRKGQQTIEKESGP
ncbi:hypothetical protein [Microbispora hainanensis]|uniref:DUF4760 domain-containing protein n=1 Tax=Microbispora hainanensis TaxID=568844 RepID=A0ABZ1ST17_9ACTN|nr:hypothetical protein [Microbispora hainanensis]